MCTVQVSRSFCEMIVQPIADWMCHAVPNRSNRSSSGDVQWIMNMLRTRSVSSGGSPRAVSR